MPAPIDPNALPEAPVTRVVVTRAGDAGAARRAAPGRWLLLLAGSAWLGGHLGENRFASLVGGEGLRVSDDLGLASGFRVLVAAHGAIVDLARLDGAWFGLGFLLLVVPVASLVAARPDAARTGGSTALAAAAAATSAAISLGILLWLGGTTRGDVLAAGLLDSKQFPEWLARLERIAGLDWMLLLASAAWTALAFRLPLPRWVGVGAGSLAAIATFGCWYGGSGTLGTVEQFDRPRPMVFTGSDDAAREPVIGTIGGRPVAMGGGDFPGLHSIGESRVAFSSPQSLREFLTPAVD
jgi:hypothetical protein